MYWENKMHSTYRRSNPCKLTSMHFYTYWNRVKICNVLFLQIMETLLWDNFYSTRKILFFQISSVKNFWVAARVKKKTSDWRCKSSVKNLYSIRENAWNLSLSEHISRYELAGAALGRKLISADLILLVKLKYRNK